MNTINICSSFIRGEPLCIDPKRTVQISTVAYEHQLGIPARFCSGLLPSIELVRILRLHNIKSIIRLVDPTPIANHCNGWSIEVPRFRDILSQFLQGKEVDFFFDTAEQVSDQGLKILHELGDELKGCQDSSITEIVGRIKESGKKHGGESGANNAILYMAAHPFSWLDMHHDFVWKRKYGPEYQLINVMSRSEERFAVIRNFLLEARPDLATDTEPRDAYMTLCSTPCYIPLEGEPVFAELDEHGYNWCLDRYVQIKKISSNHERAYRDFRLLMSFLGLENR